MWITGLKVVKFSKNRDNISISTMEEWIKITILISLFACFRDFRPVDSFYTSYLTSPAVNFTSEQVSYKCIIIKSVKIKIFIKKIKYNVMIFKKIKTII